MHNALRGEAWAEFFFYSNDFSVADAQSAIRLFSRFLERDVAADEVRRVRHAMPWPAQAAGA